MQELIMHDLNISKNSINTNLSEQFNSSIKRIIFTILPARKDIYFVPFYYFGVNLLTRVNIYL